MTAPILAPLESLEARLSAGLQDSEELRALAALEDASALVLAEVGPEKAAAWLDPDHPEELGAVPPIVATVVLASARRAFLNPEGYRSESLGDWSASRGGTGDGSTYLSAEERRLIRNAAGWTAGLGHVELEGLWDDSLGTVWVPQYPDTLTADPFPLLAEPPY